LSCSVSSSGRHLVVLVLPAENVPGRVGFTVSKKVGNAVTLNRVRRRLKEFLRQGLAELPPGHDVVLIAYPSSSTVSSTVLLRDLQKSIGRFPLSRKRE
ncbi:MAG: ribonuclease P protein component, partial [Myxococcota bacterium]